MNISYLYRNCTLCPRKCGADRSISSGFCRMMNKSMIAKAYLHKWEEPCISWNNGAGTIFFSGCNLHCCFCQNNKISSENFGVNVSIERLSEIFLELQDKGADNIELVTPTHFLPDIICALDKTKHRLSIPVVYNCGGYELTQTIDLLNGYVDIYLPDLKYMSSEISAKYSNAPDYFEYASKAIIAMIKQVGPLKFNADGGMLKGTIIRHLVMPGARHDSIKLIEWISENTSTNDVLVSIMSQYIPFDFIPNECNEIKRKVTKMEYASVVKRASELGINGYTQDTSSASIEYTPDFDLTGI